MADIFAILEGAKLKNKEGEGVTLASIRNSKKAIGLYFSAHWCPPCRGFTPTLAAFYQENNANFEIIFVSSDRDATSCKEYYDTMPWLQLEFGEDETKEALSKYVGVTGIPHLFVFSASTGETLLGNARGKVAANDNTFIK